MPLTGSRTPWERQPRPHRRFVRQQPRGEPAQLAARTLAVSRGQIAGTRPRRALLTPFARGQTAGPPRDAETQRAVLRQALALLPAAAPGTVPEFQPWREPVTPSPFLLSN